MAAKKKDFSFDAAEMFVSEAVKKAHEKETAPEPTAKSAPAPAKQEKTDWVKAHTKVKPPEKKAKTQEEINRSKGVNNIIDANGEKRTRRVQLLVRPSLYDRATAILEQTDMSFSSLVDDLLTEFVEKNG